MSIAIRLTILSLGAVFIAGCAEDAPPPRTVTEFLENPILLEAAMVRCSRNRSESRYDPECMNAREAVDRIEAREEEVRRAELEARSEAKRRALRRTQEAQAEARRRAEEAEQRRREADYLAQFGVLPPSEDDSGEDELVEGNVPLAVVPQGTEDEEPQPNVSSPAATPLTSDGSSNAPVIRAEPQEEAPTDLQGIREELQRRNEGDGS